MCSVQNLGRTYLAAHLFDQLCGVGQVTDQVTIDGADHGTVVAEAAPEITNWFEARFDGDPPPDGCP